MNSYVEIKSGRKRPGACQRLKSLGMEGQQGAWILEALQIARIVYGLSTRTMANESLAMTRTHAYSQ